MKFSDLSSIKVHIIGINGIGMSALAIYLKKKQPECVINSYCLINN